MPRPEAFKIAVQTDLSVDTCEELLKAGWTFVPKSGGNPSRWVSRQMFVPTVRHKEPACANACKNVAPHPHGLACDRDCPECRGVCHPNCPAYKE